MFSVYYLTSCQVILLNNKNIDTIEIKYAMEKGVIRVVNPMVYEPYKSFWNWHLKCNCQPTITVDK